VDESNTDLVARYREVYVARRRCPADDRLEEWAATTDGAVDPPLEPSWS
jgi:hypothetical protein